MDGPEDVLSALVLMWGVTTERQGERCGQP